MSDPDDLTDYMMECARLRSENVRFREALAAAIVDMEAWAERVSERDGDAEFSADYWEGADAGVSHWADVLGRRWSVPPATPEENKEKGQP